MPTVLPQVPGGILATTAATHTFVALGLVGILWLVPLGLLGERGHLLIPVLTLVPPLERLVVRHALACLLFGVPAHLHEPCDGYEILRIVLDVAGDRPELLTVAPWV